MISGSCKIFEDAAGEAEMKQFALANWSTCLSMLPIDPATGKAFASEVKRVTSGGCHRLYHFEDIAIEQKAYRDGQIGTHPYDLVHAIDAAILVLQGKPAPEPFHFTERQALMVLVHYIGDLHQPLHVGAIYLDASGKVVDPDKLSAGAGATAAETDSTAGGNAINVGSGELHGTWDTVSTPPTTILAANKKASKGPLLSWAGQWTTESLGQATAAFKGMTFSAPVNGDWRATLPAGYASKRTATQKTQIQRAGWRLTQVLLAIWPD